MASALAFPGWSEMTLWYLAFIVSIVAHEAAHAWAALRLGDRTAYEGGQVTLDPVPHIRREPVGTVVVPLVSFVLAGWMIGWASTPYDREWARRAPNREAWMALAGPAANLALVLVSALLIRLGVALGSFHPPAQVRFTSVVASYTGGVPEGLAVLLSIFFTLNLILLVFNLIPLPPMDGSSAIRLLLGERLGGVYAALLARPGVALLGLIIAWNVFGDLFRPIHLLAMNLLYPGAGYH